jgi:aryl-alcohol dehydrogenase-like predicted oxidoreductase
MPDLSRLCFGSLCIGPLQSNLSVGDGARVILRAIELGVNFIDTAQLYKTYPHIKAALDLCPDADKNKIAISTKTYAHTRALAKEALDEALRALGREYIDIFLLHEQESEHTIRGHIEALEYLFEQKKNGKIKKIGISTHHVSGVSGAVNFNRTYDGKDKLEVIHPMYNITGLGIIPDETMSGTAVSQMETALSEAKDNGFFVFSMKPLGGGNLFADAERALGFCLDKPFIDCVAVGMKSEVEVEANVKFFGTGSFTDEYYKNYPGNCGGKRLHIDDWCEGCGACVPACPANALALDISGGNMAVCDRGKCVLCGYCSTACGCFAIKII